MGRANTVCEGEDDHVRRMPVKTAVALSVLLAALIVTACAISEEGAMDGAMINGSMGRIYGVLQTPSGEGPWPLVILSHGFNGTHGGVMDYAAHFCAQGFAAYCYDFCGGSANSKSEGSMLDMSVLTEAEDLDAVIDHFKADGRFDGILLWGASQGGFVSAYVAARRPADVRAMALEFPAFVIQDDARKRANPDGSFAEQNTALGARIGRKYNEDAVSFDIYDVIGGYDGPVLILHGDRDGLVPISYSRRAAEVYASAEMVVMPGEGHGFMSKARDEAKQRETAFFQAH